MESYFTVMFNKGMNQGIEKGIEKERKEVNDLIRWLMEQGEAVPVTVNTASSVSRR